MSAAGTRSAAVIKVSLRSGTGHRVSISDATGLVVSVWDAEARAAWAKADDLDRARRERAASCQTVVTRRPTR
ncbi:hypothetical protein [Corallococcus carmarthensis]|uniref:Uncharacterized protein n=1 Tax=Corallococcus carmarthensis TaxID=2316728 RepID=A0A3A8KF67_9BACT|nr:hypothetical protein [Corallococcus carmarthensis]RKH02975.1 hypothetical protein D7X32_15305 [Corallococcus carmarthensis]